MKLKAPSVTSLRVLKLSANFVHFTWDNVGGNFYYIIERRLVSTETNRTENIFWEQLGYTSETEYFDSNVIPGFTYQYRIRSTYTTFEPSDWVESDVLKTFTLNAYNFTKMNQFIISDNFIREKFVKNNRDYVNFDTNRIMAGLMDENFVYNSEIRHISSIQNNFVVDNERYEIQGDVTGVCRDRERTMIAEINDVLYLFERFQPVIKVSNDRGQNWVYYQAFNGRVGNPIARQCSYQSSTTTYVLGYNEIYYGRPSTDLRWSENIVKMSTTEYTFAKIGDDESVGFPVEIFGKYIDLPADLNERAHSMAATNNFIYVAGRGYIQKADIENPRIDDKGNKLWEPERFYISPDNDNRLVIKKLDVLNDKLYALVTGRVKLHPTTGTQLDPTKKENVEPSEHDGIYVFDANAGTWTRIFGSTEEERTHIDYTDTNMSTDGKELFFTYNNYSIEIIADDDLPNENSDVQSAVKYSREPYYSSDKQRHLISFRTTDVEFRKAPEHYHGETQFVWGARGKTRAWINPEYKVVVVYPEKRHEQIVDEELLVNREIWNKGEVTIHLDNINFTGFSKYANGIMIYKSTGEIIGYYEFDYRVRDFASIFWKPSLTMLTAYLIQQTSTEEKPVEIPTGLVDPDLSPLLNTITPENYMYDDGLLKLFCDEYMQYISSGDTSHYNKLKNMIRNKYPKEKNNFEYLYSEINRRNIYIDKNKRDEVVRFFETRASDFYSTKGVAESYKFLFKLLYNADVEIEVESMNGMEYDIVVQSGNITEDIVGTTVYTPTGRANVTYIEREYNQGKLQWRVTIHNLIGKFLVGQQLKSERDPNISADILVGVRGKDLAYNDIDYINRGRVYYVMKIKSEIALTRYKDDVLRFVHPVGFGFIGVTLLTVLINSGISFKHRETMIRIMKTFRWDSGLPNVLPDTTYRRDANLNVMHDPVTGEPLHIDHPLAGQDPIVIKPWNDYDVVNPDVIDGKTASERRRPLSPVFDAGWLTYAYFSTMSGRILKDKSGLPRDPRIATQIKVEE
ncbi:MAG: baseplate wedge subunit [Bacilli bacterium]